MTSTSEKKVLANALEVYVQVLRGESVETAMARRPYTQVEGEGEKASDLSIDRDVCAQEHEEKTKSSPIFSSPSINLSNSGVKGATQNAYEKLHGLVSRKELEGQLIEQTRALDDTQFHAIYSLVWSIGAGKLLYKIADDDRKALKQKLEEAKKE